MERDIFLKAPIDSMCFSEEFRERCRRMGFLTIGAIIDTPVEEIVKMKGFNYHWLAELSEALNERGLLHRLQPLPGSIRD